MNPEDFVSYEQAVKLKECGFDESCITYLNPKSYGKCVVIAGKELTMKECVSHEVLCPSLSQAAKWLREVKGIYIEVKVRDHNAFETEGKVIDNKTPHLPLPKYLFDLWDYRNPYTTYESALSAGIDAALELIKEKV